MKPFAFALRVVAAWVYLVIVQMILGMMISAGAPVPGNVLPWFLLSTLLVATTLCVLGARSDWRGWRLALALSTVPLVITLTNYLEGIIFLTGSSIDWSKEILRACLLNIFAFPLWLMVFRRGDASSSNYQPFASRTIAARLRKFAAADLCYPVLYFVAGTIIFPYVRDFYATQTLPPVGKLFALQLFVRGPIFVAVCLLMTRMLGLTRLSGALALGAIFTTLSGIAPLIIPSGVFPEVVRWAHFFEVAISNFIFGMIVGLLWGPPKEKVALLSQAA
jgi:hypothetical protein